MSIFEHHRFEIWNQTQHPYKHDLSDLSYTSSALPGISTMSGVLDWIVAVLYPTPKPMVATPAALPAGGNTIGDYRVVTDDGDGKSAGYRWEQREGDAVAKWYKIYDMDFGAGSVLQQAMSNAQELFVQKFGNNDLDSAGVALTGTNAGQHIYGGLTASTNLTLHANAGDGVGAQTGFVQFADMVRPTSDNAFDLGSSTNRFRDLYVRNVYAFEGAAATPTVVGRVGSGFDTTGIYWASGTLGFSVSATSILELGTTTSLIRNQNFSVAKGVSGSPVTFTVTNSSNTASSQSIIDILMAGTTAASPILRWSNGVSGNQWSSGMDQGDSFKWKLSQNSNVGSNDFLTVSTAGLVTVGASAGTQTHIINGRVTATVATAATIARVRVEQTDNTSGSSNAEFVTSVGGASGGDARVQFAVTGVTTFTMGIDNSDSDNFKISGSTALGTTDLFTLSPTGSVTLGATGATATHLFWGYSLDLKASRTGDTVFIGARNTEATDPLSGALSYLEVNGASAGDPYMVYSISGVQSWAHGADNSDSDKFKIAAASTIGIAATDYVTITTGGLITLGATNGNQQHVVNGKRFQLIGPSTGSDGLSIEVTQQSSSAGAAQISLNGLTAATTDLQIVFSEGSGDSFAVGLDKSDAHSFVISSGAVLGTTNRFRITTGGAVSFPSIGTTASAANAFVDGAANNNLLRSTSSARYKKNIEALKIDSSLIFNLRPVEFDDKTLGSHHFGLVAEEVAKQIPLLVHWSPEKAVDPTSDSDVLVPDAVQYQLLSVLLLNEVKKLKNDMDEKARPIPALFKAGKWFGSDAGEVNKRVRNIYSFGEHIGLRLENLIGLPEFSAKNTGRLIYCTSNEKVYIDAGWGFKRVSSDRYIEDIKILGDELTLSVNLVDEEIEDATRAVWQLCNSGNDFERVHCSIKTPNAKTVVLTFDKPLQAGNYRLIGIE